MGLTILDIVSVDLEDQVTVELTESGSSGSCGSCYSEMLAV